MGLVVQQVNFDGRAPSLLQIVQKITQTGGLPLTVEESSPTIRGNLFDLHARLAFARFPKDKIEVTTYRTGAVSEQLKRDGVSDLPLAKVVQGAREPSGTQTVYMQGYMGQEPTLFFITAIALEALGGRPRFPITDAERREFGVTVALADLERRYKKTRRHNMLMVPIGIVMGLLWLPFGVLWLLLKTPSTIRKARRIIRDHGAGHDSGAP